MKKSLSSSSRVLVIIAAIAMLITLFVPLWSISLDAPQYPEGLSLQIWANKIAGDVDIINGLNHYIGMKTLHTADFFEFTILPYLIVFFALLFVSVAIVNKKKWLYIVFTAFVLFGIIAMVDFWKWEYEYGHHLDPNAAIKVPGMAYQPPLIGFKQLLNFGAYSIPALGGWLFVASGCMLLLAIFKEKNIWKKIRKNKTAAMLLVLPMCFIASCNSNAPQTITLHKDACAFCKMTIADARFMTQTITKKGRAYKFDDLICMLQYNTANNNVAIQNIYVTDHGNKDAWIDATTAWYVISTATKSPMGGNCIAFLNKTVATEQAVQYGTNAIDWNTCGNTILPAKDKGNGHQH